MKQKRHTTEEIIRILREADGGKDPEAVCRSRECLAWHVARKLTAADLIAVMEQLVAQRGVTRHIRSANGREFVARALQAWLAERHVRTLYIEPGSPWQNGLVESFHGSLRDECLDRELMLSVAERPAWSSRTTAATTTRNALMAASAPAHPSLPRSPNSGHQIGKPCACRLIYPPITATRPIEPNLSHVLDQNRGLDQQTMALASSLHNLRVTIRQAAA